MRRIPLRQLAVVLGFSCWCAPAWANVYTVTDAGDAGTGTLRWAIDQANGHAGPDSIVFDLPGSGVRVIALASALPSLSASTLLLGDTQPGYAGAPIVRLDGQDLPQNSRGLDTGGPGVLIRGLQIVRFAGPGIRVWHDYVTIQGNRIGTDGVAALANQGDGIACIGGSGLVVGGLAADAGNVISGNVGNGLLLGAGCDDGVVWGNRVGTDATGTAALPNQGSGLSIVGSGNAVGDVAAGGGNVISGNAYDGVRLWENADGNVLLGNRIGTDVTGAVALANGSSGVRIAGSLNVVGGAQAGAANVISGNGVDGVVIGPASLANQVLGNRIGSDAAGASALGNARFGIWLAGAGNAIGGAAAGGGNVISANGNSGLLVELDATSNGIYGNRIGTDLAGEVALGNAAGGIVIYGAQNLVGGAAAGAGNLISGNAQNGIAVYGADADGNQIVGNTIGANAGGLAALGNEGYGIRALAGSGNTVSRNLISGNGRAFSLEVDASGYTVQGNVIGLVRTMTAKLPNHSSGLDISTPGHQIGGTAPGDGNVIAGNDYYGVSLDRATATGNVLEGNWIGTNPAGAADLGNASCGVALAEAQGNTIGGVGPGAGNVIAHNGYLGVYAWSGDGNAILGNSIHDNVLLGIDLEPQGPTPNDAGDWDLGANRGQNFPVVVSAVANGGDLEIEGFLDSHALTEYRIELFSNPDFDPTGVGEGARYLGATIATTDAAGHATFSTTLPAAGGDAFVTATATGPTLDTSELSPAIAVGAPQPGELQIWRDVLLSYEGTPGLAVTIVRSHGVAGTVAVDVATVDDSAHAPDDYGAVATTLTFAPGETMRSVFVPIVTDGLAENAETWRLQLANPQGGAALGPNSDVLAWLFDASPDWPIYTIADAQIVEGDSGQRNLVFTVTLSASDHDVPIEWWTSDGSAVAGEDYLESGGQVLFHPGDGSQTIAVPVLGDTVPEGDELFYVHLYALANAIIWDGLGDGVILDDDGVGSVLLFADDFEAGAPSGWASIVGMP
jgi:trimeric autotransporter adhesin